MMKPIGNEEVEPTEHIDKSAPTSRLPTDAQTMLMELMAASCSDK